MDVTVQHEEEKPLLKRKDYTVRVFHKGATPSRERLVETLGKQLKATTLVVRQIKPAFGESASIVQVSVYKDEAAMQQFEPAYIAKRHEKKAKEEPAEKPKPAEEAPKEKPAEEGEKPKESPEPEAPDEKPPEKEKTAEKKPSEGDA